MITQMSLLKRGLILMVGATGSGKSTTLAAMINHRNQNSADHILTIEDPIEFSHKNIKSIVVTGTNGKSTTCKIIEHILNKNNIQSELGGNIGSPVLNLSLKSKSLIIIEASSFQLSYSKFIKPDFAIILNISKDHIDWHGSMKNYLQSKLKTKNIINIKRGS